MNFRCKKEKKIHVGNMDELEEYLLNVDKTPNKYKLNTYYPVSKIELFENYLENSDKSTSNYKKILKLYDKDIFSHITNNISQDSIKATFLYYELESNYINNPIFESINYTPIYIDSANNLLKFLFYRNKLDALIEIEQI